MSQVRLQPATPIANLAEVRAGEVADAAKLLGAELLLGQFPDGELAGFDRSAVEARLVASLRRWSPQVVLTFGPDGLYWHPDHIAVHERVCAALDIVAREGLLPRLDYATCPVLWGSEGTVSQHSFHQLLHQGTQAVPVDFIDVSSDRILSANLQAQAQDRLSQGYDYAREGYGKAREVIKDRAARLRSETPEQL